MEKSRTASKPPRAAFLTKCSESPHSQLAVVKANQLQDMLKIVLLMQGQLFDFFPKKHKAHSRTEA